MEKVYYNKLVRDKIPEKIRSKGADCKVKELRSSEFSKELIKKVGEEADGLDGAKTKKELVSELADITDVIEELKRLKKITNQEIEEAQRENYKNKGGFRKKLFLVWSSDDKYKSNERRYL